ncbi:MAG: cellulase family glycosylhydrolase [Anaerolineae bacterium]|nr:cellulase family glycosylhydrolase [Anaerolineae bacterium]
MQKRDSIVAVLMLAIFLIPGCQSTGITTLPEEATPTFAAPVTPSPTIGSIKEPAANERIEMTKWDLWSSGEVTLRGINIHQRLIYEGWDDPEQYGEGSPGPPFAQEDFDQLAALGANYVNISHPGLFSEEPPFELNPDSQANLDRLLDMIAQADMFAVISFRTGPGRSEFSFMGVSDDDPFGQSHLDDTVWEDQAAQDAWVDMWKYTADRYRENGTVVGYDLMVEPNANAIFFDIYWPPDFYPAYANTLYDWNRFYPHIIEAIRQVDPDTPILAGAMSWSQVDWLPYLKPTGDPRTVYTFHQYAPHDYTHQYPNEQGHLPITYPGKLDLDWDGEMDDLDRDWLTGLLSPVSEFQSTHGLPVAVNEYGVMRFEPGAAAYLSDLIELLEELGINHALWAWTPAYLLRYGDMQEFEYRLGPDMDNLTEPVPNELLDVIVDNWKQNTIRPSQVVFVDTGQ